MPEIKKNEEERGPRPDIDEMIFGSESKTVPSER